MYTCYRPTKPIQFSSLFSDRFKEEGAAESKDPRYTTSWRRCLGDGIEHVWVYRDADGNVASLAVWDHEFASLELLKKIEDVFGVEIVSEKDPRYWGYETGGQLKRALAAGVLPPPLI